MAARGNPSETSGWGWINGNRLETVYQNVNEKGSAGGVEYGIAEIMGYCILNGITSLPNMQWHTHPGFRPYWSGTDFNDQNKLLGDLVQNGNGPFYFLVFDGGMEWRIRRYVWEDNGVAISYQEGTFLADDGGGNLVNLKPAPLSKWTWGKAGKKKKSGSSDGVGDVVDGSIVGTYEEWDEFDKLDVMFRQPTLASSNSGPVWWMSKEMELTFMRGRLQQYTDPKRFDELFKLMNVQQYDWDELKWLLDTEFPESYIDILDHPEWWASLAELVMSENGSNNTDDGSADVDVPAAGDYWGYDR